MTEPMCVLDHGDGGRKRRRATPFERGFVLGNVGASPPGCAVLLVTGHWLMAGLFAAIFLMSMACLARFGGRL